jgi:hypothetical protein
MAIPLSTSKSKQENSAVQLERDKRGTQQASKRLGKMEEWLAKGADWNWGMARLKERERGMGMWDGVVEGKKKERRERGKGRGFINS